LIFLQKKSKPQKSSLSKKAPSESDNFDFSLLTYLKETKADLNEQPPVRSSCDRRLLKV
jgi:hypothetical protein